MSVVLTVFRGVRARRYWTRLVPLRTIRSILLAIVSICFLPDRPAHADTLAEALVWAYQNNPQLNAERARQRATDEGVPQALAASICPFGTAASAPRKISLE